MKKQYLCIVNEDFATIARCPLVDWSGDYLTIPLRPSKPVYLGHSNIRAPAALETIDLEWRTYGFCFGDGSPDMRCEVLYVQPQDRPKLSRALNVELVGDLVHGPRRR